MSLRTRLAWLERRGPDGGCPACRERRGLTVMVTVRELPGGTVTREGDGLAPCPLCGCLPEQVIQVVETVIAQPVSAGLPKS
jgi:hypothetical protein